MSGVPHTAIARRLLSIRVWPAPRRWAAWWPPLLLLILPIILFHEGLGSNTPPFGGDILVLDYPLLALIKHQLSLGLLPLWNNYAGGGYPLVPFSGLLAYPGLWPLQFLSVNDEITLLVIGHFALAGLGAYALAGVTGASRMGRTVGTLAFLLSGFLVSHLYAGHLFELGVIAWMPWVYLAAHRLLARPGLRPALLLGVAMGMQLLANGISFLVFTVYPVGVLLLLGLIGAWRRQGRPGLRLLGWYALAALAALALAAVLVLPFVQVLGWTVRANGLDYGGASKISLPPAALLMAFSPDAVGNGPDNTYWLGQFAFGYWHEFAFYVGLLPLLAAGAAAIYRRDRPQVPFYTGLLIIGVIFAFGRYTPLYGLAFHLPLLNLVRVPARWLLASTLSVAVLAGPGFDWLAEQRTGALALWRRLRWPLLASSVLIVVLVIAIQAIYMQAGHTDLQPAFFGTLFPAGDRLLIFGGYLALVLVSAAERLIRPGAVRSLLLAVTLLDLWCAASGYVRFLDPTPYYRGTTLSNLQRANSSTYRVLTIDRSMPNRQGMVEQDIYDAEDFSPITLRPYFSLTHPPSKLAEVSNADARDLITCFDARWADLAGITDVTINAPGISPRLCGNVAGVQAGHLTLVSAVATESWLLPDGTNWNPSPHFQVTYLYHNDGALPRAFLVPLAAARTVSGSANQLRAVFRSDFAGLKDLVLDPGVSRAPLGLGFLQDAWARALRPRAAPLPTGLQPGEARVLDDTSNSVQVVFRAAAPSYLVLNDAYYPGWQAWLDGKPVPIRRADYLMRAIQVPAGTHRLVFTYAPLSYLAGLAISGFAALVIVAVLLISCFPPKKR